MAQETAASMTAPRAWLIYAWTDALLHPKFATFQRWFPLMKTRWRTISLVVSLILILANVYAVGVLDVFTHTQVSLAPDPSKMLAYFAMPRGLFRVFFYGPCSIFTMYVMPAAVALISLRDLGPYRIRLKRIFRPWMQVQPTICALLLFSTVAQIVMMALGIYETENPLFSLLSLILVPMPALATWSYSVLALSAGSGLKGWRAGWAAAIPGILVYALFWALLSFILGSRGYPVL